MMKTPPHRASQASHPMRALLALLLIGALWAPLAPLRLPPVRALPSATGNLLINGDFSNGLAPWWTTASISADTSGGALVASVTSGGSNRWDAIIGQGAVPIAAGTTYTLTFEASSSTPVEIVAKLQKDASPYTAYWESVVSLTDTPQSFQYVFTASVSDDAAGFQFQVGAVGTPTLTFDNVVLAGGASSDPGADLLIKNGSFDGTLAPWWVTASTVSFDLGSSCAIITNNGPNPWDALLGQGGVPLVAGATYQLEFVASASSPVTIGVKLQQDGPPWELYFGVDVRLSGSAEHFGYAFTAPLSDTAASFQFAMGGIGDHTICVDNVALTRVETGVRLNQAGYLPGQRKMATVVTPFTTPRAWELRDQHGALVASGSTSVFGLDQASGDYVHHADFSSVTRPGSYTLHVGADASHPFEIGRQIYRQLRTDALAYFYHNRSGIAIEEQYVGAGYARPAGHVGVAPNQGDTSVTCFSGTDSRGVSWPGCDYTLDVSGGWYDAGDHGKYVVNGGISVWTLLNLYERTRYLGRGGATAQLGDGRLAIPENDNDVSDLLDEARWELEFLLRMQVPVTATSALTGMVHHKVHDGAWTGLPLRPDQDPQPRFLYPPSTAATLNLAATAAQGARIWQTIDPAFAQRCLEAAERAWAAALAHPAEYAEDRFAGGGGYADATVDDEFYWAAAELYITTGKSAYRDQVLSSAAFAAPLGEFYWGETAALGTISLAVVPSGLSGAQLTAQRDLIRAAAEAYLVDIAEEGYATPYRPAGLRYAWGSNSAVLNNMLVLALAYDLTRDGRFLDGVGAGWDYLLGRNPMDKSYVSGYGENPLLNPHHRFWAHQKDASAPPPPPGAVSGGPNSGIEDPYAGGRLAGCAPQRCYVDHIDSWSTNEITINWNAPLAWLAAFMDEQSRHGSFLPLLIN